MRTFKLSRDKRFVQKLIDVVGVYLRPSEHALVLCADEKSRIRALVDAVGAVEIVALAPLGGGPGGVAGRDSASIRGRFVFPAQELQTSDACSGGMLLGWNKLDIRIGQ